MTASQSASEKIGLVTERFRAPAEPAEPARLQLMAALREGERTVGELVGDTGLGTANVSKHLQLLHTAGFLSGRKDGLHVRDTLADDDVFPLCDIVCGRLEAEAAARRRVLAVA